MAFTQYKAFDFFFLIKSDKVQVDTAQANHREVWVYEPLLRITHW